MTDQGPAGEAMPREGQGPAATGGAGNSRPLRWEDVTRRLTKGGWFWLVTVRHDGAPHAMPVFAAWSDPALFVCSRRPPARAATSRPTDAASSPPTPATST